MEKSLKIASKCEPLFNFLKTFLILFDRLNVIYKFSIVKLVFKTSKFLSSKFVIFLSPLPFISWRFVDLNLQIKTIKWNKIINLLIENLFV